MVTGMLLLLAVGGLAADTDPFLFRIPPLGDSSVVGEVGNEEESNLTRSVEDVGLLVVSRFKPEVFRSGSRNTVVFDMNEDFLSGEKVKDERLAAPEAELLKGVETPEEPLKTISFMSLAVPLDGDLDLSLSLEL